MWFARELAYHWHGEPDWIGIPARSTVVVQLGFFNGSEAKTADRCGDQAAFSYAPILKAPH